MHNTFTIENFRHNTPLNIKLKDKYLSCPERKNLVDFFDFDDDSGRQKWIIEKERNVFYIKTKFNRWDSAKYLGSPTKNNQVFLYTTKNNFTKWNIKNVIEDQFTIEYIGEKFNRNNINIVIARYNENLDWALPYNDISIVYNKGPDDLSGFINLHKIINVGREGHTYLYYIITNYNNLPKRTIFLQGDWFPHNETILFGIDNYEKHLPVQPMGLVYLREKNVPPIHIERQLTKHTDYGFKYITIPVNGNHDYSGSTYFYDSGVKGNINQYKRENRKTSHLSIFDSFLHLSNFPRRINPLPTDNVMCTWCGLFSVCNEHILLYNQKTYYNIMNELLRLNPQAGTNGYILERLWLYIFQYRGR